LLLESAAYWHQKAQLLSVFCLLVLPAECWIAGMAAFALLFGDHGYFNPDLKHMVLSATNSTYVVQ